MSSHTRTNLVGIDLGTTKSVIVHLDAVGNATTLSNREGDPLTPSAVYLDGHDAIVGASASKPRHTIRKRWRRLSNARWVSRFIIAKLTESNIGPKRCPRLSCAK